MTKWPTCSIAKPQRYAASPIGAGWSWRAADTSRKIRMFELRSDSGGSLGQEQRVRTHNRTGHNCGTHTGAGL